MEIIDLYVDGDLDLLSASSADNKIAWYENDGSENFTQIVISDEVEGTSSVHVVDIDRDGDVDILDGKYDGGSAPIDKLIIFENDGLQNFIQNDVATNLVQIRDITSGDIDNNGYIDILVTCQYSGYGVRWYENTTSTAFEPSFTENIIYDGDNNDSFQSVHSVDIDKDGDLDVIGASFSGDEIQWFKNNGSQNFSENIKIANTDGTLFALSSDTDQDGDINIVSALRMSGGVVPTLLIKHLKETF